MIDRDDRPVYHTRGTMMRPCRKEGDRMYNINYSWNDKFEKAFAGCVREYEKIRISSHINGFDRHGNRTFDPKEITLDAIKKGTLVEIETDEELIRGDSYQLLRKALVRLPAREDGHQICVVLDFLHPDYINVRTAYLNEKTDNHTEGLNTYELDMYANETIAYYTKEDKVRYIP